MIGQTAISKGIHMKTIAVIFGGKSTEHDISIITALSTIIPALERTGKYTVEPVYISKSGSWYTDQKLKHISLYQSGEIANFVTNTKPIQMLLGNGLKLAKLSKFGKSRLISIDIVFPALHGTHGEDGDLMGMLEMADVPYVGCGLAASAIAMDKVLAKQVTGAVGIASTPWVALEAVEIVDTNLVFEKTKALLYPLFVKPAHLGSSIGITKVDNKDQLINAIEVAAHYDDKIIIEQGVENLVEVTLPIIGNENPIPSLLEQPIVQKEGFFDFEKKYIGDGGKKQGNKGAQGYSTIPAKLPDTLYKQAEAMGTAVYKAVGCTGIARIDMLIDEKQQKVFFNEINPMPGSLYAHNWRANGVSTVDLVEKLVTFAVERQTQKDRLNTIFTTNFLKQF